MVDLLLLGGAGEAAQIAETLAGDRELCVVTSLAGRTRDPRHLPGHVRIGGFGGPEGLGRYLDMHRVKWVIDATHPFSSQISHHARLACERASVPRIQLWRPGWTARPGATWIDVASVADVVPALAGLPRRPRKVLLTIGGRGLEPLSEAPHIHWIVRLVEAPAVPLALPRHEVVTARGPFRYEDELALMRAHGIDGLVTKNSGGQATRAKLDAARTLDLPLIAIARPPPEPGEVATDVASALAWLERWRSRSAATPSIRRTTRGAPAGARPRRR